MFRLSVSVGVLATIALNSACTGSANSDSAATGGRSSDGGSVSTGGDQAEAGSGQGGAGGDGPGVEGPKLLTRPDLSATGPGACADTTLQDFIESVHVLRPDLSDITYIATPNSLEDPEQEILVLTSANGFSLALKRGSGDCPSGCINETYWYFNSTSDCAPEYAGSYSALYDNEGNCYNVEGSSNWGIGREVPASSQCDFDPTALDVSGSYEVSASGLSDLCPQAAGATWTGPFEFVVEQDRGDLSRGEVEFRSVHPELDGQTWPAKIAAKQVTVDFTRSKSSCIDSQEVQFNYDVALGRGTFHFLEIVADDCQDSGSDYCKGTLELTLNK